MLNNISDILAGSLPEDQFLLQFHTEDSVSRINYWTIRSEIGKGNLWSYTVDDLLGIIVFDGTTYSDIFLSLPLSEYYYLGQIDCSSGDSVSDELFCGKHFEANCRIPKNIRIHAITLLFPPDIGERLLKLGIDDFCTETFHADLLLTQKALGSSDYAVYLSGILRQMKQFHGHGSSVNLWYLGSVFQCFSFLNDAAMNADRKRASGLDDDDLAHLASVEYYIDEHYMEDISLDDLTKIACMGITKLKYTFKARFGCTIITYLQQKRMREAKRLIEASDLPIREIASMVGYQSSSRFAHLFREEYGQTPLEYRKSFLGKKP